MLKENLALIKQGYEAFAISDFELVRAITSPDVVWRTPGYGLLEREYKGPEGVIRYLTSVAAMTDGTFRVESEVMFGDDQRVVSVDHITGARKGRTLDTHVIHLFLIRAGKVVEVTDFASAPEHNQAFWA